MFKIFICTTYFLLMCIWNFFPPWVQGQSPSHMLFRRMYPAVNVAGCLCCYEPGYVIDKMMIRALDWFCTLQMFDYYRKSPIITSPQLQKSAARLKNQDIHVTSQVLTALHWLHVNFRNILGLIMRLYT